MTEFSADENYETRTISHFGYGQIWISHQKEALDKDVTAFTPVPAEIRQRFWNYFVFFDVDKSRI